MNTLPIRFDPRRLANDDIGRLLMFAVVTGEHAPKLADWLLDVATREQERREAGDHVEPAAISFPTGWTPAELGAALGAMHAVEAGMVGTAGGEMVSKAMACLLAVAASYLDQLELAPMSA